jgi:hypothetical protein
VLPAVAWMFVPFAFGRGAVLFVIVGVESVDCDWRCQSAKAPLSAAK